MYLGRHCLTDRRLMIRGSPNPARFVESMSEDAAGAGSSPSPADMERGLGQYVYDESGAKYLDCVNSAAHVGHCDTDLVAVTCQQLDQLSYHTAFSLQEDLADTEQRGTERQCSLTLPDEGGDVPEEEFQRQLLSTLPPYLDTCLFCDSGTEAIDLAVRLSRLYCANKEDQHNGSYNVSSCGYSVTKYTDTSHSNNGASASDDPFSRSSYSNLETHCASNSPNCHNTNYYCGDSRHELGPTAASNYDNSTASTSISTYKSHGPGYKASRIHKKTHGPRGSPGASLISPSGIGDDKDGPSTPCGPWSSPPPGKSIRPCGDVVVVEGSFHGCTDSVRNLSARMSTSAASRHSLPGDEMNVHVLPVVDMYRAPRLVKEARSPDGGDGLVVTRYIEGSKQALDRALRTGGKVASFLCEPLLTIQGGQHPPAAWLQGMYSLVRERYGGLCIADELQSGLGRLGEHMWGFQVQGVQPDIVVLGKGIGNGHPMAVTITTAPIASRLGPTRALYKCNSIQGAIGSVVMQKLRRQPILRNTCMTGRLLHRLLIALKVKHSCIGDVRGQGLLQALDIVQSREGRVPAPDVAEFLVHKLRRVGVVMARDGIHQNVLLIMPPLTFDELNAAALVSKLDDALALLPHSFPDIAALPVSPLSAAPYDAEDVNLLHAEEQSSRQSEELSYCNPSTSRNSSYSLMETPKSLASIHSVQDYPSSNFNASTSGLNVLPISPSNGSVTPEYDAGIDGKSPNQSSVHPMSPPSGTRSLRKKSKNFNHSNVTSKTISASSHGLPITGAEITSHSNSSVSSVSVGYERSSDTFRTLLPDNIHQHYDSNSRNRSNLSSNETNQISLTSSNETSEDPPSNEFNFTSIKDLNCKRKKPKSRQNAPRRSDVFSNIIFVERPDTQGVGVDILSTIPRIALPASTEAVFMANGRDPGGGRGVMPGAPHGTNQTPPLDTSSRCDARASSLHPDERPRGSTVTSIGLGMSQPQEMKISLPRFRSNTNYQDID